MSAAALALVACGAPGSGGASPAGPPSAQSIVAGSDFSGLASCPQSGSWDDYLKAEQQSNSTTYAGDKANWEELKAAGADDGYVAGFAQNPGECAIFGADAPPTGKVFYVFVVRFKDEASAQSNYKTTAKDFHVSDSDLADVKAAGGTVTQGSATGLGENSVEASASFVGTSVFVSYWQNKRFEVSVFGANASPSDAETASKNINGRIH